MARPIEVAVDDQESIWNDVTLALAAIAKATSDQQYGQRTGRLATPEALRVYTDRVRNALQAIEGCVAALEGGS